MEFLLEITNNPQIIDHSYWAIDEWPDQLEGLEEFYRAWIENDFMPTLSEFVDYE